MAVAYDDGALRLAELARQALHDVETVRTLEDVEAVRASLASVVDTLRLQVHLLELAMDPVLHQDVEELRGALDNDKADLGITLEEFRDKYLTR